MFSQHLLPTYSHLWSQVKQYPFQGLFFKLRVNIPVHLLPVYWEESCTSWGMSPRLDEQTLGTEMGTHQQPKWIHRVNEAALHLQSDLLHCLHFKHLYHKFYFGSNPKLLSERLQCQWPCSRNTATKPSANLISRGALTFYLQHAKFLH